MNAYICRLVPRRIRTRLCCPLLRIPICLRWPRNISTCFKAELLFRIFCKCCSSAPKVSDGFTDSLLNIIKTKSTDRCQTVALHAISYFVLSCPVRYQLVFTMCES